MTYHQRRQADKEQKMEKLVTKQVLRDYDKVQPVCLLGMWISDGNPDSVPESELLKLPLKNAISDIDSTLDNLQAEVYWGDDDEEHRRRIRHAKAFLRKYKA